MEGQNAKQLNPPYTLVGFHKKSSEFAAAAETLGLSLVRDSKPRPPGCARRMTIAALDPQPRAGPDTGQLGAAKVILTAEPENCLE